MKLPPELRNQVYKYIAEDTEARLLPKTNGLLISKSPLLAVDKQIRTEFQGSLYLHSPIKTHVKDFNFSHIVTFINKLSDGELKALHEPEDMNEHVYRQVRGRKGWETEQYRPYSRHQSLPFQSRVLAALALKKAQPDQTRHEVGHFVRSRAPREQQGWLGEVEAGVSEDGASA
jgi:hypothetical protein